MPHRRRPTMSGGVGALLAALAFVIGAGPIGDNSTFTHLATGRLILERGNVPRVDPYSFSAAGRAWVVQSWLASIVYAGLEAAVGLWGLRVLNGMLTAVVVVLLWTLTSPVRSLIARVLLLSAVMGVGTALWSPRPLLFGLVGLALVLAALEGQISPRWLLPVFALWGATHGSFPLGIAVIVAVGVGTAFDRERLPVREARALLWALLGTAAIALGPLGVAGVVFPVQLLRRQEALHSVVEWRPPTWDTPAELVFGALVLAVLVLFARRGAPWRSLLPSVLAIVLGLSAVRNLSVASMVLAVAMVAPLARVHPHPGAIDPRQRGALGLGLLVAGASIVVLALASTISAPPLELGDYPVHQLDRLADNGLLGDPAVHLVSYDLVGNYLELRFGADANVFFDDRVDMYPTGQVQDYLALLDGRDPEPILHRWDADAVLWRAGEPLTSWLRERPDWDLVREDDGYVLFCRSDSPVRSRCS